MTAPTREFERLRQKINEQAANKVENQRIHLIKTDKWKNVMLDSIDILSEKQQVDGVLLGKLRAVVEHIPQQKFVEAIFNLQPYKINFKQTRPGPNKTILSRKIKVSPNKRDSLDQVKTNCSSLKCSEPESKMAKKEREHKERAQLLSAFIEEDTLSKELSQSGHPYSIIIKSFGCLMESKYNKMAEKQMKEQKSVSLELLCDELKRDLGMLVAFMQNSSTPFIDAFGVKREEDRAYFQESIKEFTVNYVRNHQSIGGVLRKVIGHFCKVSQENAEFQTNCPDFASVQMFEIPEKLRIEGRFIYTISEIIEMSQTVLGSVCLSKLANIRASINRDIDQYYSETKREGSVQVTSDSQVQILKFLLAKLKIFSGDILAQLLYMDVLYGEEMNYRYDEASYIHSQLMCAFEVVQRKL